jgi:hypothetical protein
LLLGSGGFVFARELLEQKPRDRIERGKHPLARSGDAHEAWHAHLAVVKNEVEVMNWSGIKQVALVVLQNVRDLIDAIALAREVLLEVLEALNVLFHLIPLRVGDEYDPIHAAQHELARGVVDDLARHCVKLKLGLESFDDNRVQWQEIEE